MTLQNFRSLIRLYVPGAKSSVITDPILDTLINQAANDVNSYAEAYIGSKFFNVTAETAEYDIYDDITDDYFLIGKSGIWWNDGVEWQQLDPVTRKYLDRYFTKWRDDVSGNPQRYFIEGGKINFHPKPDTTLAIGFRMDDYVKSAVDMSASGDFPFVGVSTKELSHLRPLDDAIIDYVRWKLQRPLGKDEVGVVSRQEYMATRKEKSLEIERRPDMTSHRKHKMRIPRIR